MISTNRLFITIFLILLGTATCLAAESSSDFAFKAAIENRLEERLTQVISAITGSDKFLIIVNAEIFTESKKIGGPPSGGEINRKEKEKDTSVLPGVPVKKEYGKEKEETSDIRLSDPAQIATSSRVKRLAITILMDKSIPETMLNIVREIISSTVGFNQERGDRLEVKRIDLKKGPSYWAMLFQPPFIYWLVLIVLAGFFLTLASIFLMKPFRKLSSAFKVNLDVSRSMPSTTNINVGERMPSQSGEQSIGASASPAPALAWEKEQFVAEAGSPFSFIKEKDLPDVSFVMKDVSANDIAVVINYMDPDLAMKLLNLFPEDKQVEIALSLADVEETSSDKVAQLEEAIKERLGYLVGGEDKVATILDMASDEIRDKVFDLLESRNANVASRLRQKIKSFESMILEMPPNSIQAFFRQVDPELFAMILKSSPEDVRKKVMDSLSSGAAERLQQEIDLSRPVPAVRLKKEKHNMMLQIRKMIREGLLEAEGN